MKTVAIGVFVHNEEDNLPRLLAALCAERPVGARIARIDVVSSGSTDGSDAVAQDWAERDERVHLLREAQRYGKARAINRWLADLQDCPAELCVLVSGDVVPAPGAVSALLQPLSDATVGMSGGRPVPTNAGNGLADRLVRRIWSLHHRVASRRPKLGEMVAFRRVVAGIDPTSATDEAALEQVMVRRGLSLAYVPEAVVYNRGPDDLGELLAQRRRIWSGHLQLRQRHGYEVATFRVSGLFRALFEELRCQPWGVCELSIGCGLELLARLLGWVDVVRGRDQSVWPRLETAKGAVVPGPAAK